MEIISRKEAIEKGLKRYFTGKPCKHGHVAERYLGDGRCVTCLSDRNKSSEMKAYWKDYYENNKEQKKQYHKNYREENKEQIKAYLKEYYQQNKEHHNKRNKSWYEANKEEVKDRRKQYYEENKNWLNNKKNEYNNERYHNDASYKAKVVCKNTLKRTLKATNSTKDTRTHEMLGYCNEQLKESIEEKFLEGMSWESFGDWHIDHIYPVTRYIKDGVECPATINSLDNLIPMWAEHNLEKSDRTLEEYLEDRKDLVELYGRFL